MAGTVKKLQFSEGTNVGAPTDLSISAAFLPVFANDAAYVSAFGAATNGSSYVNSTTGKVRFFLSSAWRNAVSENDVTDATKVFAVSTSGNTTGMTSTLLFADTGNRSYTFPNATTTLVGDNTTQTLSNKTISAVLIDVDNIRLDANTISTTNTDGNLILAPNGLGDTRTTKDLNLNALANQNIRLNTANNGAGFSKDYSADKIYLYNGPGSETRLTINANGSLMFNAYSTGIAHLDSSGNLTSSAVQFSELASLTSGNILVGNAGNVAASVSVSGVISLSNSGVTAFTSGIFGANNISNTGTLSSTKLILTLAAASDHIELIRSGSGSGTVFIGTSGGDVRFGSTAGGSDLIRSTTTQFQVGFSGTLVNPAYSFATDTSTGFYLTASTGGVVALTVNGNTSPSLFFNGNTTDGGEALSIYKKTTTSTTSQRFIRFYVNDGSTNQGELVANGGTPVLQATSDGRLKENIKDLGSQLANIRALRPVTYDYKSKAHMDCTGFIAQELAHVYPKFVHQDPDDGWFRLANWSDKDAYMVKAIQELADKVDAMEHKLASLFRDV